jgi:DNA-binding MurR/RpiR family transcriptional regulator
MLTEYPDFKSFIRKKLNIDPESYYYDEWVSALNNAEIKGQYEFCKSIWDARQAEIDELRKQLSRCTGWE